MSASRGADDREAFIKACADGNTRRVRRLLDRGADVEAAVDGQPANYPLLVAVRNDRHDTVRLLLERGANVNRCPTYEASEWRLNPPPNPYNLGAIKHYAILVRLHAIGTPSTRPGPDRWLLEARHHAPLIASFLSPQATRKAWSFWNHNEDCSMMDLKWTQDYMYGSPLDW